MRYNLASGHSSVVCSAWMHQLQQPMRMYVLCMLCVCVVCGGRKEVCGS